MCTAFCVTYSNNLAWGLRAFERISKASFVRHSFVKALYVALLYTRRSCTTQRHEFGHSETSHRALRLRGQMGWTKVSFLTFLELCLLFSKFLYTWSVTMKWLCKRRNEASSSQYVSRVASTWGPWARRTACMIAQPSVIPAAQRNSITCWPSYIICIQPTSQLKRTNAGGKP